MKCGNPKCTVEHNNTTFCSRKCQLIFNKTGMWRQFSNNRTQAPSAKLSSNKVKKSTEYFVHVDRNNC